VGSNVQISFVIDSLRNPISLKQTSMIYVGVQDSMGFLVNNLQDSSLIIIQNDSPNSLINSALT
jgi:hypothetical protein